MGEEAPSAIVVCRGCDRLYERKAIPRGDVARCGRCGTGLYGAFRHDLDAVLALSLSALILFVFSYSLPLMTFAASGQSQTGSILSGVVGLYDEGFLALALLVFLTATALPFCHMVGLCYVLVAGRFDLPLPGFLHAAFEVANFDDLMLGHDHLKANGRTQAWGVGRHVMGSQIFDYWKDPWGHELEHWTDGDLLTASDPPRKMPFASLIEVQWGAPNPMTVAKAAPPQGLMVTRNDKEIVCVDLRKSASDD